MQDAVPPANATDTSGPPARAWVVDRARPQDAWLHIGSGTGLRRGPRVQTPAPPCVARSCDSRTPGTHLVFRPGYATSVAPSVAPYGRAGTGRHRDPGAQARAGRSGLP